jgi:hypothetical protein
MLGLHNNLFMTQGFFPKIWILSKTAFKLKLIAAFEFPD